jgi:nucleoside-diphosphate-sugar epimerase
MPPLNIDPRAPVLVTGAAGYIASWIVRYLLEAGHTVHGTVREPLKAAGLEHLNALKLKHGKDKLKLFKADLLAPGSFAESMRGCQVVMHTASPFIISGIKDAQQTLVRPAVEGTLNVLISANDTASVKRVVLTSSVASIYGDAIDAAGVPNGIFTEEHWNTTSSVDHQPYPFSKVQAERAAWDIHAKQSRWDLVTINPGLVLGPSLAKASASTSLVFMKQLTKGTMYPAAPDMWMGVVDVRDVAQAHIKAAFTPSAKGRYITNADNTTLLAMGRMLRARFGSSYRFPRFTAPKLLIWLVGPSAGGLTRKFVSRNVGHRFGFDNTRSHKELGLQYRPVADTLAEHFEQMLDDGIVRRRD